MLGTDLINSSFKIKKKCISLSLETYFNKSIGTQIFIRISEMVSLWSVSLIEVSLEY